VTQCTASAGTPTMSMRPSVRRAMGQAACALPQEAAVEAGSRLSPALTATELVREPEPPGPRCAMHQASQLCSLLLYLF